jgi:hypothetical protein
MQRLFLLFTNQYPADQSFRKRYGVTRLEIRPPCSGESRYNMQKKKDHTNSKRAAGFSQKYVLSFSSNLALETLPAL